MDGNTLNKDKDKHNHRFNFIQANKWIDKINMFQAQISQKDHFFLPSYLLAVPIVRYIFWVCFTYVICKNL